MISGGFIPPFFCILSYILTFWFKLFLMMSKFQEIIQSKQPTLVDFYATWCGPCQSLSPVLESIKSELKEKITILKIDVDKNIEASNKFKIRSVPTLILFQNGQIIWRINGALSKKELKTKIETFLI